MPSFPTFSPHSHDSHSILLYFIPLNFWNIIRSHTPCACALCIYVNNSANSKSNSNDLSSKKAETNSRNRPSTISSPNLNSIHISIHFSSISILYCIKRMHPNHDHMFLSPILPTDTHFHCKRTKETKAKPNGRKISEEIICLYHTAATQKW